jgi:hypothetical protein
LLSIAQAACLALANAQWMAGNKGKANLAPGTDIGFDLAMD